LWVLAAIAIIGIGMLTVSELWVTSARRHHFAELEWSGAQFKRAIGSYYESTPAGTKSYPSSLQDLLDDRRFVATRRHLRVIYLNPLTGRPDWEMVIAADGTIRGVRVPGSLGSQSWAQEYVYNPFMTPSKVDVSKRSR
jgi:type II secretory pathway pseudopilin PulG